MNYAIIGFGNIGQALARAFARNGIQVSVATTRDPASFASAAAAIGPTIVPKRLAEAVKADIVFLAMRFDAHPDVANALPSWKGKTIIDAMNAFAYPVEELTAIAGSCFCRAMTKVQHRPWRHSPNNSDSRPSISGSSRRVARLYRRAARAGDR